MTSAALILERVTHPAPFGIMFRDVATGTRVSDGLAVTLTSTGPGARSQTLPLTLAANRSGVWFATRLPGFDDARLAATADWSTIQRDYRVDVRDTQGRFLPLSIAVRLPSRGLYSWPDWVTLPRPLLLPLVDEPPTGAIADGWLPLFSAPSRTAPAPMAEVRAQLIDRATGAPAAWTLVTANHDAQTRAIGMADANGQVVLFFAYPPQPRPSIATSPPAIADYRWPIVLSAFRSAMPSAAAPDLATALAQLSHPATLYAATTDPLEPLPSQLLSLGRPLTVRTTATPDGPTSALILGTD